MIQTVDLFGQPAADGKPFKLGAKAGAINVLGVVLEGAGSGRLGVGETLKAVDVITFSETEGGTLVDYSADLTFSNWLRWGGWLVAPLIRRVGTKALDGLVEALS